MSFLDNLIKIDVKENMGIVGATDEFFCLFLNDLLVQKKKGILVVVGSLFEANTLYSSLINYTDKVLLFPMDDFLTSEALAVSPDLKISRLETLEKISNDNKYIVITNLMGYLRFLPSIKTYKNNVLNLKVGDVIEPKDVVEKLVSAGYNRDTIVTKTGEIAVRGFVIDIFPLNEDNPVRLEFFGDEIDSIRYFDVDTQVSTKKVDKTIINPFSEFLSTKVVENDNFGKQKYLPLYEAVVSICDYFSE